MDAGLDIRIGADALGVVAYEVIGNRRRTAIAASEDASPASSRIAQDVGRPLDLRRIDGLERAIELRRIIGEVSPGIIVPAVRKS
jgi:hypothetical protein